MLADVTIAVGAPLEDVTEPRRAAYCLPLRQRSMILARSYSAIMPWTCNSRFSSGPAPGITQKDNFNAAAGEFLKYQHLICIFA